MEAKGLDPYADRVTDAPDEGAPDAAAPKAAADVAPVQADDKQPEAPKVADVPPTAAQDVQPVASTAPQTYRADMPADLAAKRTELLAAKAEAMKQLMDGVIDAEKYADEEFRISEELEGITLARARAETLAEVNRQTAEGYQGNVIRALVARTKTEIDYASDTAAQQTFDRALRLVASEPDAAGKDFAQIADEAHRMVMARMGVSQAKPSTAGRAAPDRTPPKPPITLGGLPTAAASGTKSVTEVVGRLAGDDLEKAFDALSDADLKKLMRG
jgi:hypothetical protein